MFDLSFTTPSSSSATSQSGVSGSNPALPSETRISKVTFLFSSIITWPFRDSRLARHIKRSVSPGSNRLIGERRAIVGDEPGITRDRIYGETEWNGERFALVDTGGIVPDDDATIPANIFKQAGV